MASEPKFHFFIHWLTNTHFGRCESSFPSLPSSCEGFTGWKFDSTDLPPFLQYQAGFLSFVDHLKQAGGCFLPFFLIAPVDVWGSSQWDASSAAHTAIKGALWASQHGLPLSLGVHGPLLQRARWPSASPSHTKEMLWLWETQQVGHQAQRACPPARLSSFTLTVYYYGVSNSGTSWELTEAISPEDFCYSASFPVNTLIVMVISKNTLH